MVETLPWWTIRPWSICLPRPSSYAQGYDKRWHRLSRWYRRRHPICADPFGVHGSRCEPGAHVDHIVPLTRGGTNDESNLQTLCVSCHSRKTVLFDGGFGNARALGDGGSSFLGVNLWENVGQARREKSRVLL